MTKGIASHDHLGILIRVLFLATVTAVGEVLFDVLVGALIAGSLVAAGVVVLVTEGAGVVVLGVVLDPEEAAATVLAGQVAWPISRAELLLPLYR